ncbi:MAG: radical SAM protein [Candidatus Cryosericum sp.]|nr:radical SAM protein [bacterium]
MMRASIGTLAVLGLRNIHMSAVPTTAYLMTGDRCTGDCAYCGQGRSVAGDHNYLSRVTWPEVREEQLIAALTAHPGAFRRICFQTTASRGVLRQLLLLVPRVRQASGLPVSVSYRVTRDDEADQLFAAGVERIGIAIDCCSESLYSSVRGGRLAESKALVTHLAARYPGRITTHLIIGLGETEREAAELILELRRCGVLVSLFAFTPVARTRMEHRSPPALISYRKLQFLVGVLDAGGGEVLDITYGDGGRIRSFGLSEARMRSMVQEQFMFVTHGCAGCNRPFYTEAPGGIMFNFPSVPGDTAAREINEFIDGLKQDGFVFQDSGDASAAAGNTRVFR